MKNRIEEFSALYRKGSLTHISKILHEDNTAKGFWDDWNEQATPRMTQLLLIEKLALAHSEVSEALEALREREELADKHLPQYWAFDVEIADAIIRLLDLAAVRGCDISKIVAEKGLFNRTRPHKHGKEL